MAAAKKPPLTETLQGMHWIIPSIGSAMYGAALSIVGTCSLTYLQDCYAEVRVHLSLAETPLR
jgi:hypothetical protein